MRSLRSRPCCPRALQSVLGCVFLASAACAQPGAEAAHGGRAAGAAAGAAGAAAPAAPGAEAATADASDRAAGGASAGRTRAQVLEGTAAQEGLLSFHRSAEHLYLELPPALLGADLGLSAMLVNAVGDWSVRGSGLETAVVRWERLDDGLVLSAQNLYFRASADNALAGVVAQSFPDSPLFRADLLRLSDAPDALLIDAGSLFTAGLVEILPADLGFRDAGGAASLASLQVFPDNVVARMVYRFERDGGRQGGDVGDAGSPFERMRGPGRLADPRRVEITVDYNLYRLPEGGYRPRLADERIGGFTLSYKDYDGIDDRDSAFRHLLERWDLRKRDPSAALSPPITPVTFYIDRGVPADWRPLVREAALWWNTAFEKVGLQDAVVVLDQPDDPAWDPADLRHSMIYWNLSDNLIFSGLAGPMFTDPRTGQVLRSNVYLNAEFPSYALHRYLVYTWWRAPEGEQGGLLAPQDVRRQLDALRRDGRFCDRSESFSSQIAFARLVLQSRGIAQPGTAEASRFAQEAFKELVAHEVGHALGFPHNWKASLVSSPADLQANRVSGRADQRPFSSSVMDYNPIYLAPRGAAQGDYFLQQVGAYDDLTVEYIYRPFDGWPAADEAAALDAIAARAEVEPGLIYDSGGLGAIDPTTNSDDLGDDPVAFAEGRLAMVREEVLPRLAELVLAEGHDDSLVRQALDAAVFSVAMDYIDMLARHVGGQIVLRRVPGSPGAQAATAPADGSGAAASASPPPIRPVPVETQRRALAVLGEQLFADGAFALSPATLAQLAPDLHYDWNYPWRYESDYDLSARIRGLYSAALDTLLEPARLARVLDNERRSAPGSERFTLPELFTTLETATFGPLDPAVPFGPDVDRRALQRLFVEALARLAFEPAHGVPAEAGQLARERMRSLRAKLVAVIPDGADPYAAPHLQALSERLRSLLEAGVQVAPLP